MGDKVIDSWAAYDDCMAVKGDMLTAAKTPADSMRIRTTTIVFAHQGTTTKDTVNMVLTPDLTTVFSPCALHYLPCVRSHHPP